MKKRTVAVIMPNGKVRTRQEPVPPLKKGQALIKVHASLISPGTEMTTVRARRQGRQPDAKESLFGYANAGEIVEINGACAFLKPGMRVAAMGGGAAIHGSYACVPVNLIVPIPDKVSFEDATYACLGATALQSVRRAAPQLGEFGAVLGLGIVGNLAAQLYQLSGARAIGWDGLPARIRIARECGIRNIANAKRQDPAALTQNFAAPYGLDFADIAFGGNAEEAVRSLLPCMKLSADGHRMGRIVLVGGMTFTIRGGAAMGNLDFLVSSRTGPGYHDEAYELGNDYPAVFVPFTTQRNLREIVQLIAEKRLVVRPMTTHVTALKNVNEMADLLIDRPNEALGVVLTMHA
jgi:threonine dehydrogenase-like Zn-dependent dehydrogenase